MSRKTPEEVLKQYFGFEQFRPGQKEIVESILAGKNTLAILATGGGKSLCYQVPGLVLSGTTLVISPLISLMKDQVDALVRKGIAATYINSSLDEGEREERLEKFTAGLYHFVYISPERLALPSFQKLCQSVNISLIAVDESHCISQWGHDFRPEYRQIAKFLEIFLAGKKPHLAAFTASATPEVQRDITEQLQMQQAQIFLNTFRRQNLHFCVHHCSGSDEQTLLLLRALCKHNHQAGIIYAVTRQKTEEIAELLQHFGFSAQYYHGGMTTEERTRIQEQFLANQIQLIVATNAFGMGVDKPNVRFVFHMGLPADVESYYQEAGRAGRDRADAWCYLFPSDKDLDTQLQLFESAFTSPDILKSIWQTLKRRKTWTVLEAYTPFFEKIDKHVFLQGVRQLQEFDWLTLEENSVSNQSMILLKSPAPEKFRHYHTHYTRVSMRLEKMWQFVTEKRCKTQLMLEYFGEKFSEKNCGQCDVCTNQHLCASTEEKQQFHILEKKFPELNAKTLAYLAILQPQTEEEFLRVPGVGRGIVKRLFPLLEGSNV